ncbi:Non-heme dioxygenase N-terminal domain [Sesbania bispinosa]|nr:Non-heme dioxygenase N-terminal domain [Sesbania bispinosa]
MVVLSKSTTEQYSYIRNCKQITFSTGIPLVDLSKPDAKALIVKACEEFGFFKVINHGVPMETISLLESETKLFLYATQSKEKAGPPNPFGCLVSDYMSAVKRMACEILDLMAEGLKIQQKNVFSKLVIDKESDSVFRLNHYPPCPELVPPDQNSFFINVGDSLQGFGKWVQIKAFNDLFLWSPLREKIAPLPSLIKGKESLYKEFTWFEYKNQLMLQDWQTIGLANLREL